MRRRRWRRKPLRIRQRADPVHGRVHRPTLCARPKPSASCRIAKPFQDALWRAMFPPRPELRDERQGHRHRHRRRRRHRPRAHARRPPRLDRPMRPTLGGRRLHRDHGQGCRRGDRGYDRAETCTCCGEPGELPCTVHFFRANEMHERVNEGKVGEGLWEVAEVAAIHRIQLLGVEPSGLAWDRRRSHSALARATSPISTRAETSQNEHMVKSPSTGESVVGLLGAVAQDESGLCLDLSSEFDHGRAEARWPGSWSTPAMRLRSSLMVSGCRCRIRRTEANPAPASSTAILRPCPRRGPVPLRARHALPRPDFDRPCRRVCPRRLAGLREG
jgi:hypothetical protein